MGDLNIGLLDYTLPPTILHPKNMPQLKNARKALRKSVKRAERNKIVLENISFLTKSTRKLGDAKDDKAGENLQKAIKAIDKAVQKGMLKKNTAARKKSRLIHHLKALQEKKK